MHFKFINSVASCAQALNLPKEHEHSAFRLHQDLFSSGIERIIAVGEYSCSSPFAFSSSIRHPGRT